MKFCINCKYHSTASNGYDYYKHCCNYGLEEKNKYDLVDGKKYQSTGRYFSCNTLRILPWCCGKEGKWFKNKDEK